MRIISGIIAIYMFFAVCVFIYMMADMVDGRDQKLLMSPKLHLNTDNGALGVMLLLTFTAMFGCFIILYFMRPAKDK